MRTSLSNVPIVELPSLSVLRSKSFSNPEAMLMSQSAAPHAARRGSHSETETAATGPDARCSPRHAPSAARLPKYPLNLAVIGRSTVAIATVTSDQADNAILNLGYTWAGDTWLVYTSRMWWYDMSLEVSIRHGESQDSLLRRFQRMVQVSGVLREVKTHRYFMSKGETARLKAQKSARRRRKQLARG